MQNQCPICGSSPVMKVRYKYCDTVDEIVIVEISCPCCKIMPTVTYESYTDKQDTESALMRRAEKTWNKQCERAFDFLCKNYAK